MDHEAKVRQHQQRGNRTIAHYAERATNLLDPTTGGRNLQPFLESHSDLIEELRRAREILDATRTHAQAAMKETQKHG